MKIDLGCGNNKRHGYIGVDGTKKTGVDIVHNLNNLPLPFDDESATDIELSQILEHVDEPLKLLSECHRILVKDGGQIHIRVPHGSCCRSTWDNPEHKRGFAIGWFKCLETGEYSLDGGEFKVISTKLHYSNSNYRGKQKPRLHERILDYLANNINQRHFERLCVYWVGGYEELEITLQKKYKTPRHWV